MHNILHRSALRIATLLLMTTLTACGTASQAANSAGPASSPAVTSQPAAAVQAPATPASSAGSATKLPPTQQLQRLGGTGTVKAAHTIELNFPVAGRVAQVLVAEGDTVKQGQLLAVLDTRPFDNTVAQAEADLRAAQAAQAALTEAPDVNDVRIAEANVRQAQIGVGQAQNRKAQDLTQAQAAVDQAQSHLEATRNTLSAAKTEAELQMQQATGVLTQAQANYSQAKTNWEYVQETGKSPVNEQVNVDVNVNSPVGQVPAGSGKTKQRTLTDAERQAYYNQFVAAEAALHNAERGVAQAQVAYDNARQNEVSGIREAEQLVTQTQAEVIKIQGPPDQDSVAAAQTNLVAAQAARRRLNPAPKPSSKAIAAANVARAESALSQARLSREYAELRAPYDGIITGVGADVGELAGPLALPAENSLRAQPVITMLDTSAIHFEVAINEADIGRVAVGQAAELTLDALPDQRYTGNVSYIAPAATLTGTIRTYLVRIRFDHTDGLRDGMSGQVFLQRP